MVSTASVATRPATLTATLERDGSWFQQPQWLRGLRRAYDKGNGKTWFQQPQWPRGLRPALSIHFDAPMYGFNSLSGYAACDRFALIVLVAAISFQQPQWLRGLRPDDATITLQGSNEFQQPQWLRGLRQVIFVLQIVSKRFNSLSGYAACDKAQAVPAGNCVRFNSLSGYAACDSCIPRPRTDDRFQQPQWLRGLRLLVRLGHGLLG